jgi:hypothetical protein
MLSKNIERIRVVSKMGAIPEIKSSHLSLEREVTLEMDI